MRQSLFSGALVLLVASQMMAAVVTNISTGQTDPDSIWTITAGGSGQARVITNPITIANAGPWVNPPAGSAWVSTTTANTLGAVTYSLETSFDLGPALGVLEYRALADNELRVYVDNVLNFTFIGLVAGDFSTLPALQTVNLAAGFHTVRLDVTNVSSFSGVLLSGTVTSDVPEPSTFGGAGLALAMAAWWKRRKSFAEGQSVLTLRS